MAQPGFTPLVNYNTTTPEAVPLTGNLLKGELAINVADKKVYTKDGFGNVIQVGSGPDAAETLTNKTISSPVINTPTGITKNDVGLGAAENKPFSTGIPDAAHAAATKATPVDADEFSYLDSAASWVLKKLTWANVKATMKGHLDGFYALKGANADITSLSGLTGGITSVSSADYAPQVNLRNVGSTAGSASYYIAMKQRAGGTAVANTDTLGTFMAQGFDGAWYYGNAGMGLTVDGTVSSGIVPTRLTLFVADAAGAQRNAMVIAPTGIASFPYTIAQGSIVSVLAATYTVAATVRYISCHYGGTVTLTLPSPSPACREIIIKTIQNQLVVSASANVYPINSATIGTAILPATAGKWAKLVSDGAAWTIMQAG